MIELRDSAAKKGSGRIIPMHAHLRTALVAWRRCSVERHYVAASERGGPMTPLSIVVWFNRAFRQTGLTGCSSHSGSSATAFETRGRILLLCLLCAEAGWQILANAWLRLERAYLKLRLFLRV